jgi:hypothetical protein
MQALTRGLLKILGNRLVGVYLGGSLSMGDFCAETSDMDFLVVTRGELSMEDSLAVELLHRDLLRRHPYAARLEGDYAPVEVLVAEGTTEPVPGCERGIFLPKVYEIMLSADNIANMRQHGITFFGPPPAAILPPVSPEQVRAAVRVMMEEGPGTCTTPRESAAALLSLLRSASALDAGAPATKSQGARWGLEHLPPEWHPAIQAALLVRCGNGTPEDDLLVTEALQNLDSLVRLLVLHECQ